MNISLTPQLENLLKEKVATGMYHSVSEVVREALRLLNERDSLNATKLYALRQDIMQGIVALDNGEGKPLDIKYLKSKGRQILTDGK
jgi:antitoxin ParD1/3/4